MIRSISFNHVAHYNPSPRLIPLTGLELFERGAIDGIRRQLAGRRRRGADRKKEAKKSDSEAKPQLDVAEGKAH